MDTLVSFPGHQRLVAINNYPIYLEQPFAIYPQQTLEHKHYIQGGPRTQVHYMGGKTVKGNMNFPITLKHNGDIDDAVKEILLCAEYPERNLTIETNYTLSKWYITADWDEFNSTDNTGFGIYERMAFTCCGITNLTLKLPEEGNASISIDIIGLVDKTESAIVPDPSSSGMMRRQISYADCDVYLETPEYHWDTSRSFDLKIENNLEAIFAIMGEDNTDYYTDLPALIGMGESKVSGTITYSVDRGTAEQEKTSFPSGSYIGSNLTFDLSGLILAQFPRVIMDLTEQPIEIGLLQRTSNFIASFNNTQLNENEGHLFTFPE